MQNNKLTSDRPDPILSQSSCSSPPPTSLANRFQDAPPACVRRRPPPPPLVTEPAASCAPPLDPYPRPTATLLRARPWLTLAVGFGMVAAAVLSPPRLVLLPYAICGMLLTPAPVLLLLRLCAVRLGADRVEPSHDAIHPIPRGVAALHPAAAASRTATSPGTTTFRASSSTTSGSRGASPTRPRASRPRRTPSPARVEVQQVLADVRVMAACPQRAARAYPVRVGQGWQHPHPGRSRRAGKLSV
jgi:hypothetical protein